MQDFFFPVRAKSLLYPENFLARLFLLLLLANGYSYSQEQRIILKNSVWLKDTVKTVNSKNIVPPSEEALKDYFNFNSTVLFSKRLVPRRFDNIINNQSSVFVVYKSTSVDETNLMAISKGVFKASITTKKIESGSQIKLNKGNPVKGVILSYLFNKNSLLGKRKGSLSFDNLLYDDKEHKNQLMELVYIPATLPDYDRNLIESYLSVKYGISLNGTSDYYDSDGNKTWSFEDHADYNFRVTGIGKDDYFGLDQKQSGNSEIDGLYIGLGKIENINLANQNQLIDKTFLIWGDNNKSALFGKDDKGNSLKTIKRIWKAKLSSRQDKDSLNLQVLIDKNLMPLESHKSKKAPEKEYFWMAIDSSNSGSFNYATATYIKATENDQQKLVFTNIVYKYKSPVLFTIAKAPDFFTVYDVTAPDCALKTNGKVNIKIVGGTAPYQIRLESENFKKEFISNEAAISVEGIGPGNYSLKVSDVKNSGTETFTIDAFPETLVKISDEYYLKPNENTIIVPESDKEALLTYEWIFNGKTIGSGNTMSVGEAGGYKLIVTNQAGCSKELPFLVKAADSSISGQWNIFPNPVAVGADFSILFKLGELSNVSVSISEMGGKMLKNFNLGVIQDYELKSSMPVAGTYLVTISQNNKSQTAKLIVR